MLYVDKKYGFYRVNYNQQIIETSSKIEALEISQSVNSCAAARAAGGCAGCGSAAARAAVAASGAGGGAPSQ